MQLITSSRDIGHVSWLNITDVSGTRSAPIIRAWRLAHGVFHSFTPTYVFMAWYLIKAGETLILYYIEFTYLISYYFQKTLKGENHLGDLSVDWSIILLRDRVTIDGVSLGNRIYWPFKHTTRDYALQITITQRLVFSVTFFTALLGNVFQQRTFLRSWAHVLAGWRPSHTISLLTDVSGLCRNDSWSSLYSFGRDGTENTASIIPCSLVAAETCPQSCSLAMAVILSPDYTAVTWQWVYMPQY
jgi:hypothetical protein